MKTLIRRVIGALGYEIHRRPASRLRLENARIEAHVAGGAVPWSFGYTEARNRFIVDTLGNDELLQRFRNGLILPERYGRGFDERCIEYPWLFANGLPQAGVWMDAGSALNHDMIIHSPFWDNKRLHICTLAPEATCCWQEGISYLFCDLRQLPIRDSFYDAIACVSTLEHIGFDNTAATARKRSAKLATGNFTAAVKEFSRVLKPGGTFYLTVPYGTPREYRTFQVFGSDQLQRAIDAFGPCDVTQTFYRYTTNGWNVSSREDCGACTYVEWVMQSDDERSALPPVEPDLAAAARAVACVRISKA